MAWNRAHVHLTEKQDAALGQMFGHMTETYAGNGRGCVVMEPYTMAIGTNKHAMSGFTNASTYRVVSRTADSIVMKTTCGFMSDHVATVHFDGPDAYWLPLNEDEPATSAREYFIRIKETNQPSEGRR
jgi:hypothetical protein